MASTPFQRRISRPDWPVTLIVLASSVLFLALCTLWFQTNSAPKSNPKAFVSTKSSLADDHLCQDSPTFYDDPTLGYSIDDKPIKNWDQKRRQWLKIHHPSLSGGREKILLVTGSQPRPCRHPDGDHFLLRLFKNKVDYSRIHGHQVYYSNTFLHPKMKADWVKLPVVQAAMLAHPESEWIWWVDSDAVFTDMEFTLPLKDYKDYNMVVWGWPDDVFKKKSWVGLNAGVFLVRNCQWTMDFIQEWASMGPISPDFEKRGRAQQSVLSDKMHSYPDDQSALTYLLLTQRQKWADEIYLEGFYFQAFWADVAETFESVMESYMRMDSNVRNLRRRRAEKDTTCYAAERERFLNQSAENVESGGMIRRRPFLTHFCGCAPCSGTPNSTFRPNSCWVGMEKALNFADNQILRSYGFVHKDLDHLDNVSPLPFDLPLQKVGS